MSKKIHSSIYVEATTIAYLQYLIQEDQIESIGEFLTESTNAFIAAYSKMYQVDMADINQQAQDAFIKSRKPRSVESRVDSREMITALFEQRLALSETDKYEIQYLFNDPNKLALVSHSEGVVGEFKEGFDPARFGVEVYTPFSKEVVGMKGWLKE